MNLNLEGESQRNNVAELEKSLIQARSLACSKPLVRGLLCCVRNTYGALEEIRIINEHRLVEFLAD